MEPLQFCYWLQGFAEINGAPPTEAQWQAIRDHLQSVFEKKTPQYAFRAASVDTYNNPNNPNVQYVSNNTMTIC